MGAFSSIEALVLAGGAGTRLARVLPDLPKALAPVARRPFIAYVLDRLRSLGVPRTILCTGYLGERIREALGDDHEGMPLSYSHEDEPLGTGGALRLAAGKSSSERLLVLNGDSWSGADWNTFAKWHEGQGARAGILLSEVPDASRFGRVLLSEEGLAIRFEEKGGDTGGAGWINAGVYLFSHSLMEEIPGGRAVSLEREIFPLWAGRGLLSCRKSAGAFIDIGTEDSYGKAEAFFRAAGLVGGKE